MLTLLQTLVVRLRSREEGQTFVEYALVIGGVSLALVGILVVAGAGNGGLDDALRNLVTDVTDQL